MAKAALVVLVPGALRLSAIACGVQASDATPAPDDPQWVEAEAIAALATKFYEEDRRACEIAISQQVQVFYYKDWEPQRPEADRWSASYQGGGAWAVTTPEGPYLVLESGRPAVLVARATATPDPRTPTAERACEPVVGDYVAADKETRMEKSFTACRLPFSLSPSQYRLIGGGTRAVVIDVADHCDTLFIQIALEDREQMVGACRQLPAAVAQLRGRELDANAAAGVMIGGARSNSSDARPGRLRASG